MTAPSALSGEDARGAGRTKADIAGGGGVPCVGAHQLTLGAKPLHEGAGGHARLRRDGAERQLRGSDAQHHPHHRREYIGILPLPASWAHRCSLT